MKRASEACKQMLKTKGIQQVIRKYYNRIRTENSDKCKVENGDFLRSVFLEDDTYMSSRCNGLANQNDTLFGCENYEECHRSGHDGNKYEPSAFEKMMVMKSAQLSLLAYNLYKNSTVKSQKELENSGSFKFDDRINPVESNAEIIEYTILNHSEYKSKGLVGVIKIRTNKIRTNKIRTDENFRYVAIVAFRGSVDDHEWFTDHGNLNMRRNSFGFHRGQFLMVQSQIHTLTKKLDEFNKKYNNTIKDVIFTGHSLGGCEASIAPAIIKNKKLRFFYPIPESVENMNLHTISFGPTRIGDEFATKTVQDSVQMLRIFANCGDRVPILPTWDQYVSEMNLVQDKHNTNILPLSCVCVCVGY